MTAMARRASKYNACKTIIDGIEFDSRREAKRWKELRQLEDIGEIRGLKRQVVFEVIPRFKLNGKTYRPTNYVADFVYYENGITVVEDCKGFRTPEYRLKKKLVAYMLGIEIRES